MVRKIYGSLSLQVVFKSTILSLIGLSRGRGITMMDNLKEIQTFFRSKDTPWIIMKYIENPLIVSKRKFDIRQWVLVTDWDPLTIWFYEDCYIRFSAEDYDAKNLKNRYIHLCNNSIAKYSKNDDMSITGNMWNTE